MRFAFSADQLELRDAVATALADACPPTRVRAAWAARDTEIRSILGELGVLGLNVPEAAGGMGLGPLDWVLIAEACGKAAVPTPIVETFATSPTLAELGEDELLADVAAGTAFVSLCGPDGLTVDADLAAIVLRVGPDGVAMCRAPEVEPVARFDGALRTFRVRGPWRPVDVDAEALADRASLAAAAQLIGLGTWMLDTAVEYAKARRQFGKPIGAFQAVQHHLVDALLPLRFAAPMVHRAAWCLATHAPDRHLAVASAKLHASEAAQTVAAKALQVHGAIGYTFEHDLHLWMKRAWVLGRAWGDAGACLDVVRDAVLTPPPG